MTNIDPVVDTEDTGDSAGEHVAKQSSNPTTPPSLPDEYTDSSRSSLSEDPAVAGHLETHWGF